MRFQLVAGVLVLSLAASAVALSAPRARPDLVVSSLANPPGVVFPGHGFRVHDRTRNTGSATARATVTQYYFSANGHRTAGGRRAIARLRPGRSSSGSATATAVATLTPGIYSFVACADASGAIREANEHNNCRTAATKIIIKKPPPPV